MKQKIKSPEEIMKNNKVLSQIDIPLKIKKKLQKEARNWIKYIQLHSDDMHQNDPFDNQYHKGEISFIEFFFFFKPKKLRKQNDI
jgi:hypothetical protein